MRTLCLAVALSLASHPVAAQTMDPAVVEAEAASSSAGLIVPLLGLLLLIAVISGPTYSAPLPG